MYEAATAIRVNNIDIGSAAYLVYDNFFMLLPLGVKLVAIVKWNAYQNIHYMFLFSIAWCMYVCYKRNK